LGELSWVPMSPIWPGPTPTSTPSGILIHPATLRQQIWAKIGRGAVRGVARCKNVGWTTGERGAPAYNGGLGAEPPAGSRGRGPGQGVRGRRVNFGTEEGTEAERFCQWNTQTRGKSCHFRIQLVSIPYRLLSHWIWAILMTRLSVVRARCAPRDYFIAITGVEWPKNKRMWEWDGQWTVQSSLHCHVF